MFPFKKTLKKMQWYKETHTVLTMLTSRTKNSTINNICLSLPCLKNCLIYNVNKTIKHYKSYIHM